MNRWLNSTPLKYAGALVILAGVTFFFSMLVAFIVMSLFT